MTMQNTAKQPTVAEMLAIAAKQQEQIAALMAELAAARKASTKAIGFKIGEKGGLSVTGLGRFPVTLYGRQWLRLLEQAPQIKEFITANHAKMSWKAGDEYSE